MPLTELYAHIDNAKLFLAKQLMDRKDFEKALLMFESLKDPYASYHQSQIYQAMAEEHVNEAEENVTSQMRTQRVILLTKARDCLYLTLDRLRDPAVDSNHPLNAQLGNDIEQIEHTLLGSAPESSNRNEFDIPSNGSEITSNTNDRYAMNYSSANNSYLNGSATPKRDGRVLFSTPMRSESIRRAEARPSPERLDAQLRQLVSSKDAAIGHVLEQNRMMVEAHRSLVDELRGFRDAVSSLTSAVGELQGLKQTVEDLRGVKESVDQLKNSVDELQVRV